MADLGPVTLLNPSDYHVTVEPDELVRFVAETDAQLGDIDAQLGDQVNDLWIAAREDPAAGIAEALEPAFGELELPGDAAMGPDLVDARAAADEVDELQQLGYDTIPGEAWSAPPAPIEETPGEFQPGGEQPPPGEPQVQP